MPNKGDEKHVQLVFDRDTFEMLKEKKQLGGFDSWEEFITSLTGIDEEFLRKKKIQKMKDKINNTFLEVEANLPLQRGQLELIRILALLVIDKNIEKAEEILKKLQSEIHDD